MGRLPYAACVGRGRGAARSARLWLARRAERHRAIGRDEQRRTQLAAIGEGQQPVVTTATQLFQARAGQQADLAVVQALEQGARGLLYAEMLGEISKLRPVLEKLLPTLEQIAADEVIIRSREAVDAANRFYEEELSRLSYLQSLNPAIRDEELLELKASGEACQLSLSQAKPALEGLRVCIAV